MSTKVSVDITTRAHAILSASSSERWLTCTPSARLEEHVGDKGSSYAHDGTAAHAFAELRLRYKLGQTPHDEYVAAYEAARVLYADVVATWEQEDWDSITAYVDYVLDRQAALGPDTVVRIEAVVDYSRYAEGGFGTSDALLVSETAGVIEAIDLKFGKGVPVSAYGNTQARLYTLGGFLGLDPSVQKKIKLFRWAIVQPRIDNISDDEMTGGSMREWAETVVKPQAELAWRGEGKFKPSEKACRFCKVSGTCRARAAENVLIARKEFEMAMTDGEFDEQLLTPEDIAKILPKLAQWKQWASSVEAYALKAAVNDDVEFPGYKLVRGRSNRAWAVDPSIVAKSLAAAGVDDDKLWERKDPTLKSPTQMEKSVGAGKYKILVEPLVTKPPGAPALVPVADPRQALNPEAEALKDFGL